MTAFGTVRQARKMRTYKMRYVVESFSPAARRNWKNTNFEKYITVYTNITKKTGSEIKIATTWGYNRDKLLACSLTYDKVIKIQTLMCINMSVDFKDYGYGLYL